MLFRSRLFENNTDDQNRYTEEFRQLAKFDDPRYNEKQRNQIRKFFNDLSIVGFIQSGFNKSNVSFQDIIPYEMMANVFRTSLDKFQNDIIDKDTSFFLSSGLYSSLAKFE